jgi:hypothetical protein
MDLIITNKTKQNKTKQTNKLPSFIDRLQLVDIRLTTSTSLDIPHVDYCNSPNQRSNTLQASSCASSSLKPEKKKKKQTHARTNYLKQPKCKNEEKK